MSERPALEVEYDLSDVLDILRAGGSKKVAEPRRIKPSVIDHFLFSGRFNSVLGPDGFRVFKAKLKDVIACVNDDDFGPKIINLDKLFEVLLESGVYYLEEHLPADLAFLKKDERWLTAYRYIAKNFPDITYSDFRVIVSRFKDGRGHSFYIEPNDSELLTRMTEKSDLFQVVVEVKATLLQMSMKQLRETCDIEGISPARRLVETVDRIVDQCGDRALDHVPQEFRGRKSIIIKDQELATGDDIIHLDTYLRAISKVVREDLIRFVFERRSPRWT